VASLASLRSQKPSKAAMPFVGFGHPLLPSPTQPQTALARMRALRRQADLAETRAELTAIAAEFRADESALRFGADASEHAVKTSALSSYRVIAFSTHASLGRDSGTTPPSLLLASSAREDGRLTTSEIEQLTLDANLVLLLGCDTAAADGTPDAEGFSGLTRAFLHAGSRALLVSHWAIPSEETVALVTAMFADPRQDRTITVANALRRAMLDTLDSTERADLAHPVYWASFVLVGDGTRPLLPE
jgi:CHAT domain-containing protein